MPPTDNERPLGILAGSGEIPLYVANKARNEGRRVFIVGLKDAAEPAIETFPHEWISWGEIGKLFNCLGEAGVKDLVIVGGVRRPRIKNIQFDFGLIRNLPFLLSLTMGGDDEILSRVIRFFEEKGLEIKGVHQLAPELLAQTGCLTNKKPNQKDIIDINKGIETVLQLGTMDIGQGAVVARNYVLCVEAAEGTDAMLERAAGLRQWGNKWLGRRFGVLVKWPKPHQELRIDMPAIGPRTIDNVANAGLAGICIAAGSVLISEKEQTIEAANRQGIFIIGADGPL